MAENIVEMLLSLGVKYTKMTNAKHLAMEELDINKGRNGCMGGTCCGHLPACLRPGPKVLR